MHFLSEYLKGIAIGAGAILPGISSGVLCVILGIYEKLINSVLDFFQDWKKNLKFLFPIFLGGICGVFLFSKIIEYLLATFPMQTKYCFIGLILGCVPILFKQANQKSGFHVSYLFSLLATFSIACILIWLEKRFSLVHTTYCVSTFSFPFLILSGFLMSIGVVVPGVSSTVILMLLGVYDLYLSSISNMNIAFLFPMGIGLLIGGILFLKIIQFLLKKYPALTYYGIIGFVFGSVPILFPGFSFDTTGIASILCLVSCLLIGYYGEKK